jgi:hypothetical protein
MSFHTKVLPKDKLTSNNYCLPYIEVITTTAKAAYLKLFNIETEEEDNVWIPLGVMANHNEEENYVYVWNRFADEHLINYIPNQDDSNDDLEELEL